MHISNRSIAVDRRNWLCAESKADGERAASIHSFIETRKADDLAPKPTSPVSQPGSPASRN